MQGSPYLVVQTNASGNAVIVAQGVVQRPLTKDGTHYLCKVFKKGYSVNQVVSLAQFESYLIFDSNEDLAAFIAENTPPPQPSIPVEIPPPAPRPAPPPVDNDHVAPGCEKFADNGMLDSPQGDL